MASNALSQDAIRRYMSRREHAKSSQISSHNVARHKWPEKHKNWFEEIERWVSDIADRNMLTTCLLAILRARESVDSDRRVFQYRSYTFDSGGALVHTLIVQYIPRVGITLGELQLIEKGCSDVGKLVDLMVCSSSVLSRDLGIDAPASTTSADSANTIPTDYVCIVVSLMSQNVPKDSPIYKDYIASTGFVSPPTPPPAWSPLTHLQNEDAKRRLNRIENLVFRHAVLMVVNTCSMIKKQCNESAYERTWSIKPHSFAENGYTVHLPYTSDAEHRFAQLQYILEVLRKSSYVKNIEPSIYVDFMHGEMIILVDLVLTTSSTVSGDVDEHAKRPKITIPSDSDPDE